MIVHGVSLRDLYSVFDCVQVSKLHLARHARSIRICEGPAKLVGRHFKHMRDTRTAVAAYRKPEPADGEEIFRVADDGAPVRTRVSANGRR